MIIPAITLYQPWASLIACGAKVFETRAFPCPTRLLYRRIAIHAAKRSIQASDFESETAIAIVKSLGISYRGKIPYGAVVCTAIIKGCEPADKVPADHFGDYSPGRWAWRLKLVERIDPPVPAKGQRMIGWPWDWHE